jgi:hypothetical protein
VVDGLLSKVVATNAVAGKEVVHFSAWMEPNRWFNPEKTASTAIKEGA